MLVLSSGQNLEIRGISIERLSMIVLYADYVDFFYNIWLKIHLSLFIKL